MTLTYISKTTSKSFKGFALQKITKSVFRIFNL